jgi:hypothetical protein
MWASRARRTVNQRRRAEPRFVFGRERQERKPPATTANSMTSHHGVPGRANSNPGRRISLGRRVPTGHPCKSCNCHIGIAVLVGAVDQPSRSITSSLSGNGVIPPCAQSAATRRAIGDRRDLHALSCQTDRETAGFQTLSGLRLRLPSKLPEVFHRVPSCGSLRVEGRGVW